MVAIETNQKTLRKQIVTFETLAVEENIVKICNLVKDSIKDYEVDYKKIDRALKEALKNVCIYAYSDNKGKIYTSVFISNDTNLEIEIKDLGCGIKDVNQAVEMFYSTKKERKGMGFTCMKVLSKEVIVDSVEGRGTIVTLKFKMF